MLNERKSENLPPLTSLFQTKTYFNFAKRSTPTSLLVEKLDQQSNYGYCNETLRYYERYLTLFSKRFMLTNIQDNEN